MIKFHATFDNVNVRQNGTAVVKLKVPYSEVADYIQLVTVLAKDLHCRISVRKEKIDLGSVFVKQLNIDQDGEAKVTLVVDSSTADITQLLSKTEDNLKVMLKEMKDEEKEESKDE